MINCHASSLVLDLKDLTGVTIQNCTFGDWTFRQVQNIFIENIKNTFDESISTSLNFYNSTAFIKNMTIKHENLTGHLEGISAQDFSILHIELSNFLNNTVKHGLMKVLNLSNLVMSNCSVSGNYAEEDAAAIYANESHINITNTYLENNYANVAGGAIFAETLSRLQFENCTFRNNEANITGGAIHLAYFSEADLFNVYFNSNIAEVGGAMYITDNSTLNANYLSASHNAALIGSVTGVIGSSNISCENCFLSENIAEHRNGAAIQLFNNSGVIVSDLRCFRQVGNLFGCIYAKFDCTVSVNNSTFALNTGSALTLSANSYLIVISSNFLNNSSPRTGGAILSTDNSLLDISYSLFDGNKANIGGGAIYQENSTTKLNQCSFLGNSDSAFVGIMNNWVSVKDSYFENNMGQLFGGALSITIHGILNVSRTTFKNNNQIDSKGLQSIYQTLTNSTGRGAAILLHQSVGNISKSGFYNNYASFEGGAVCISTNSSLSVSHTTFENNVAGVFGGAILSSHSFLNVENSNFYNNSVLNEVIGMGGGLFLYGNSTTKISKVLFSKCHANLGGAIVANFTKILMADSSLTSNTGSAIFLFINTADINNCTFVNNSAPYFGGAILCQLNCNVNVVKSNFIENRAGAYGGAVLMNNVKKISKLTVHNCSFIFNIAPSGGAMYVGNTDFSISDSTYSNNTATEGGVITLVGKGIGIMTNCWLINNTAHAHGGVFTAVNGSLQMLNCLVSNNTAKTHGGVLLSAGSTVKITNSIFKMNTAFGAGGVFFVGEGTTTLVRNSSFVNNFAEMYGGVIFEHIYCEINITQSSFFGNRAKQIGGVLVSRFSTKVLISDTEISQNSGKVAGAIWVDGNSVLELNGSQIVNNNAQNIVGGLYISNNSLFVGFNSSFKRNNAISHSSLRIRNSTAYLEKCTFIENFYTFLEGTIFIEAAILNVANTLFADNTGYDIYFDQTQVHSINRLDTYRCLFKHDNFSLKSNMNRFEQIAIRENIINNASYTYQIYGSFQETPYASSKMIIYLP